MTLVFEDVGVGGGDGEYVIPRIDAGSYEATVVEVKDGEFPSFEDPSVMDSKYLVDWQFDGYFEYNAEGVMTDKPLTLRQFVRIPPGLGKGYLHEKAKLYEVLQALQLLPAPSERFRVDPNDWLGRKALVLVEKRPITTGTNAGKERPIISHVAPPLKSASPSPGLPTPSPAHQALLSALGDKYGGLNGQKVVFLEENKATGDNILELVCSLSDKEALALAKRLGELV